MRKFALATAALVLTGILAGAQGKGPAPAQVVDQSSEGERARKKIEWVFSLAPKSLQKDPILDMTVFTEMTEAGRTLEPPTAEKPAFYELHQAGYKFIGEGAANRNLPVPTELEASMRKALHAGGYHPAELPGRPPTLLIIMHWGSHNALDPETIAINPVLGVRNLVERAALVGGDQFARDLMDAYVAEADTQAASSILPPEALAFISPVRRFREQNDTIRYLVDQAGSDVYFVIASVYDYAAAATGGRMLLWRTKMTVNTQGVSMVQTLPPLITNASVYFGRETTEAVPLSKRGLPEGTVEIGTPTVIEVIEASSQEATPSPAPRERSNDSRPAPSPRR